MAKFTIPKFIKGVEIVLNENSTQILTVAAITGTITTALMTGKAVLQADQLLQKHKDLKAPKDKLKLVWRYYIPPTLSGISTIGFIIGLNHVHASRNAALAGLYSIAQTAFKEYQEKVVETIGDNKERKVRDAIDADHVRNTPQTEIIMTGNGDVLCFDSLSGRYFKSDIETIRQKINELNRSLISEMFISLNEFYYELGLDGIELGNNLGFNIDHGLLDIHFTSQLTKDGKPCLVLNYEVTNR